MDFNYSGAQELLEKVEDEKLYAALLHQLNKDFTLANVDIQLSETIEPGEVQVLIKEKLYHLILEKFDVYLNLLYIIDVPQKEFKNIHLTDAVEVADQMMFLVLRREFQKVWFKRKYST